MGEAMSEDLVIGVDVGTGSARAGVFTLDGRMRGRADRTITTWQPKPGFMQQSSEDIWRAVCCSVREAVAASGEVGTIRGIGFDATCSLVALDAEGGSVSVDPEGEPGQDVILWADHRAEAEAAEINAGGHEVLRYVGGRISLEMETPKLLWLKRHLPAAWRRAARFFDLPDFLTYRATGAASRSLCSTVCKWTYLGHEGRWDEEYFRAIGLGDLADEGFARIGKTILPMGAPVGDGLSAGAAGALGLPAGIAVGASAIDAHAGGIGLIGAELDGRAPGDADFDRRLALIGGTSSCHMAVSRAPRFVQGVWGPYFSAMVPEFWLNEGGQSMTGALVDFVVGTHPARGEVDAIARAGGVSVYEALNARLSEIGGVTEGLHVFPDFHGNRSPLADPTLRGMISGLSLSAGVDELARLYLATIQAIAYGTRHIIEAMNATGYAIDTVFATGGGTKNPVFLREHADATGCRIVLAEEAEAVLLGAAALGAVAGGAHRDVRAAMAAMTRAGRTIAPDPRAAEYHARKYRVFRRMHEDQMAYRRLMAGES